MAQIDDLKAEARADAKTRRAEAYARHGDGADALAAQGLAFCDVPPGSIIAGFSPFGDEIDPRALMRAMHGEGHMLALPVIVKKGQPLVFRKWVPDQDELVEGQWGIMEPAQTAEVLVPNIVLTPLLAFDPHGYRVGYGGGFYDRSLAEIRTRKPHAIAIGIAYDEQEIGTAPKDPYDQRVDWVLTPSGPRRCRVAE